VDQEFSEQVDLWGNPWFESQRKRGRPSHVRTVENANKINLLFALGGELQHAAAALGITMPTLRKHYKQELKDYFSAKTKLKGALLMLLWQEGEKGNVAAIKEMAKMLDLKEMRDLAKAVSARPQAEKTEKPVRQGKKELQLEAAADVEGKFSVPDAPMLN